jgi:HlyD family secretion protein
MYTAIKVLVVLALVGGASLAAYIYAMDIQFLQSDLTFREVELTRGSLVSVIRSGGSIKPIVTVNVGSFVSGPVREVLVDFNEKIEQGALMARIDSKTYEAAVARDEAILATSKADLKRLDVLLEQAKAEEARTLAVKNENTAFISVAELDAAKFNRRSVEAQMEIANAAIKQAEATMRTSRANLEYTEIRAPVSGIVIDRRIEPGQTLASQFQIPELFVIAQDMDREIRIVVAVDEADIGAIIAANQMKRPVSFSVDAYPDEEFKGTIKQIRASADSRQAVVTYPVVISVTNPDARLLPGMTASVNFEISARENVLLVPNAALRIRPDPEKVVPEQRAAYRTLLDLKNRAKDHIGGALTADGKKAAEKRLLWQPAGKMLRYVEVSIGENNDQSTEILDGPLKEGDRVIYEISGT